MDRNHAAHSCCCQRKDNSGTRLQTLSGLEKVSDLIWICISLEKAPSKGACQEGRPPKKSNCCMQPYDWSLILLNVHWTWHMYVKKDQGFNCKGCNLTFFGISSTGICFSFWGLAWSAPVYEFTDCLFPDGPQIIDNFPRDTGVFHRFWWKRYVL